MPNSSDNSIACAVCGGTQVPTTITHHARRGATIYVFENVPAYVCDQCGEVWLDGSDYGRLVPV